ncbi:MAG: peptidylprolyl isomerase [Candidatus Neomarinimicrobiota bacterium]
MKRITLVALSLVLLAGCASVPRLQQQEQVIEPVAAIQPIILDYQEQAAVISTAFGEIVLDFFPTVAPLHVESFLTHARNGYYDGTTFHRVIPGFVIQGGDPNSRDNDRSNDGWGGAAAKYYEVGNADSTETWMLPAEFSDRPHRRGALSMARSQEFNSAGSQFFICADDVRRLDTKYTVFGEVVRGLEVVDRIVAVPRDSLDNPLKKVTMTVRLVPRSEILPD